MKAAYGFRVLTGLAVLLGNVSCHNCDAAIFSEPSGLTLVFDKAVVIQQQLEVTITADGASFQGTQPARGLATGNDYLWYGVDTHSDSGLTPTVTRVGLRTYVPKSITYLLVADGVVVAQGSATPTYEHLNETHDGCSQTYDQATVPITIQQ